MNFFTLPRPSIPVDSSYELREPGGRPERAARGARGLAARSEARTCGGAGPEPFSERDFAICLLLEIPLRGFPFQMRFSEKCRIHKSNANNDIVQRISLKRKSPHRDLKQETYRKHPVLHLASLTRSTWRPPPRLLVDHRVVRMRAARDHRAVELMLVGSCHLMLCPNRGRYMHRCIWLLAWPPWTSSNVMQLVGNQRVEYLVLSVVLPPPGPFPLKNSVLGRAS